MAKPWASSRNSTSFSPVSAPVGGTVVDAVAVFFGESTDRFPATSPTAIAPAATTGSATAMTIFLVMTSHFLR